MKEFDKEVRKRYDHTGTVKADVNALPAAVRAVIYVLVALAVLGIMIGIVYSSTAIASYAIWVAAGAALAVVMIYLLSSAKSASRYFEVMFKCEGKYLVFQVISEKHVIFTDGEYTLEYKKREVKEIDGIMNAYLSWNSPYDADFVSRQNKGGNRVVYIGKKTVGEKQIEYKVTCEGKFVTGFKANGRSVTFDCLNRRDAGLGIPAALAQAITERGTALPADQIFINNK